MLVRPANFAPMKGMTRKSAWAWALAGISQTRRKRNLLPNEQAEESSGEQGRVHVPVLQRERRAQAVAVGEKDQREVPARHLDEQRRVRAGRHAELPVDALAVVVL